ncbi:hypothetical protein MMC31_003015 [Peltigera leucophlebia]|nr:hypothetical protein [Peltigera leucophlebia]
MAQIHQEISGTAVTKGAKVFAGTAYNKTAPRQRQKASAAPPPPGSAPPSNAGDDTTLEGRAANNPNSAPAPVSITAAEFLATQQRISNLEAAQQNPRRRRRSDSGRAPKRSHLRGTTPDDYWGENHPKLDAFICRYEQNFCINSCDDKKTRVAYAGSFCRGTHKTQWQEYKHRPERREPHVITWDNMWELRGQLGEGHVYIDKLYDKWQRATQRSGQTGKEYRAYLQSIRTNLLELDEVGPPNETQLTHRMRQDLRSEPQAALYRNGTVPLDWPAFLEAVARAESSVSLEQK